MIELKDLGKSIKLDDYVKIPLDFKKANSDALEIIEAYNLGSIYWQIEGASKKLVGVYLEAVDNLFENNSQKLSCCIELKIMLKEIWDVIDLPSEEDRQELFLELAKTGIFNFDGILDSWDKAKPILEEPFQLLVRAIQEIVEDYAKPEKKKTVGLLIDTTLSTIEMCISRNHALIKENKWREVAENILRMLEELYGVTCSATGIPIVIRC